MIRALDAQQQALDVTLVLQRAGGVEGQRRQPASDRQPILPVLLYIGFAITIYIILGLPLTPFNAIVEWLYLPLQALTSALVFTIVLDLFILGAMYTFEVSVMNRRQPPKKKKARTRRPTKSS